MAFLLVELKLFKHKVGHESDYNHTLATILVEYASAVSSRILFKIISGTFWTVQFTCSFNMECFKSFELIKISISNKRWQWKFQELYRSFELSSKLASWLMLPFYFFNGIIDESMYPLYSKLPQIPCWPWSKWRNQTI